MLEILDRLCEGRGARRTSRTSRSSPTACPDGLCGLRQTAPNPVLTSLRYFREEFEAHVRDRRCPADGAPPFVDYRIDASCVG